MKKTKTSVQSAIQPWKKRGDLYLELLNQIQAVMGITNTDITKLPNLIQEDHEHLAALRIDRLNYDDLRAALQWINDNSWVLYYTKVESLQQTVADFLSMSGLGNALLGAPVSDTGAMRSALRFTDNMITDILKAADETMSRDVVLTLWEIVHMARRTLKAIE